MDAEAANAERCRDQVGRYEAWYLTLNDPASRRGYWFRYTTLRPGGASAVQPHAALWAFAFDHDDPCLNTGGRQVFPLEALQVRRPFGLGLAGGGLGLSGCAGRMECDAATIRWQLTWTSLEPDAFPFLRRFQSLSSVGNIGAQPSLQVSGSIEVNGKTYEVQGAAGGQQHTWGRSHALRWNWGFAAGPDFWLDGATSHVASRLGRVLRGTALGVRAGGERVLVNGLGEVLRAPGAIAPDSWRADVRHGADRLQVAVTPRREDLIGVAYDDPNGGFRYCYHAEVAGLEIVLTRGGRTVAEVRRPAAAAFEYGSQAPLDGVRLLV